MTSALFVQSGLCAARTFRSLALFCLVAVSAGCANYGGYYPGHPKFQAELNGEEAESFFRRAQKDGKAVLVQRMPRSLSKMPEWRKPDGTPAGEVVFSRRRHFAMLDGEWHSTMSDKFAMVAVEPGDYFLGGGFNRYSTVALQEKPTNLLPKPAPAPLGYARFASEMWSEPYIYTETVDYYKPVITGFVGAGYGAVPVTEDMYMGTRNYAATGYRKAIPTVTEYLETTLFNGGLIQTLKTTARAGEILILPEMQIDPSSGFLYANNLCSEEGRREWICPIVSIPYLFKPADVRGFIQTLKDNWIVNPWSTIVKEAVLVHDNQLKPTGFGRDGYGIFVLGETPSQYQQAKPVQKMPPPTDTPPKEKPKGKSKSPR